MTAVTQPVVDAVTTTKHVATAVGENDVPSRRLEDYKKMKGLDAAKLRSSRFKDTMKGSKSRREKHFLRLRQNQSKETNSAGSRHQTTYDQAAANDIDAFIDGLGADMMKELNDAANELDQL